MVQSLRNVLVSVLIVLCVSASLRLGTAAQVRPIYDQGSLGLEQRLRRLDMKSSVLMIGAHPDDEDTALLAYLARGENARTAYLSLTRGDGGQNIIGPELGEALGVIRTEELLQARNLDGAEQFFTRAYDYGFSKTLAEAKQKWDERVILCDVVRVIRTYKPMVVISQFTGTPADGHGQHQFSGYIVPLGAKASADASQCPDAGPVWTVQKFYVRHRGQGEPTLRINTGVYSSLLGRSYFEIAMHARSQHRSQEQGVLELKGDQYSNLNLIWGPDQHRQKEEAIFQSLEITRPRPASDPQPFFSSPRPLIDKLLARLPDGADALLRAAGIRIDVLADRETAVPGDAVPVAVRLFTPREDVRVVGIEFNIPHVKGSEPQSAAQGPFRRETAAFAEYFNLDIPVRAPPTQPYWLRAGRTGDMFALPDKANAIEPFGDPAAFADVTLEMAGKQFAVRRPVEFRFADDIRGEIRRELNIVPKITVTPDKNLLIISTRAKQLNREVSIALTNNVPGPVAGKVRLKLPDGWKSLPAEADFAVKRKGESTSAKFLINLPTVTPSGSFEIGAEAITNGEIFSQTMQTIAYEHIQTHRIYRPAKIDVKLIDVQAAPVKVGYIRGTGDRVPEAIRQLGLAVDEIDDAMLASGDLSKFQTIVVGIRAYQVRPALVSNNQRLMDFAKNGGTLIVQYQLPPTYSQLNMAPFPAQMGPRVADENAPVTILEPTHPVLSFPNKITQADFTGWVQERNLYNFSTMDPKYTGLLESHDPGEAENKGGLVVADLGKGKYVYCSYSLFRQLPAGVPGAYRLLANLLSLPAANRVPSSRP